MRAFLFRIIQNLLCIIAGVLISMIEIRFFKDAAFPSAYFFIILIVTVFTVFLYARSESSIIFVFIYTVCLTLALEALGNNADITVLLGCFFALVLLYAQTRFKRNAEKKRATGSAHGLNFLTVLICASMILFSTFQIYTHVLLPLLPESARYALLTPSAAPEEPDKSAPFPEMSTPATNPITQDTQAEQNNGPTQIAPPSPQRGPTVVQLALIAAAVAVCILIAAAIFRYGRYKMWLRKTLASPPDKQFTMLYAYLLYLLAVCGYPRQYCETTFEYLHNTEADGFPLPSSEFCELTAAFNAVRYGGKAVTASARDNCLALLKSLPALVKAKKGRRFYYLYYIPKIPAGIKTDVLSAPCSWPGVSA